MLSIDNNTIHFRLLRMNQLFLNSHALSVITGPNMAVEVKYNCRIYKDTGYKEIKAGVSNLNDMWATG